MEELKTAIRKSWGRTQARARMHGRPSNPSFGQCAVTALVVQDYFGGRLKRLEVLNSAHTKSHYYNELPEGKKVDLTREQFTDDIRFGELSDRSREVTLSSEPTRMRYNTLRARVHEALNEQQSVSGTGVLFKETARGKDKNELVIARACATDYDQVKSLLVSELGTNPDSFTKEKFEAAILQFGKYYLVAKIGGKAVGFVSGFDDTGIFYGYMGRLVVDPEYRNQGIGTQLVEACLEEFRKAGVASVFAGVRRDNAASKELLSKAGFKGGDYIQVMNPL
jgi:ribosomal protein S18 acetylase RimI-like enzyme